MQKNSYHSNVDPTRAGFVYLVGAGPGDPGLLTLRGLECLQRADVVVYDRLASSDLLAFAPQASLIDVGKESGHHAISQEQINAILVAQASSGKVVTRLKGGDPFVFGRGGEEALALVEAGIPFEIVPGVTSAIAAPAYAGIPVTQRGMACSVAFITGHNAGNSPEELNWQALAHGIDTLVFLMGVQNLAHIVASLLEAGKAPDTPVALVEQGTLPIQRVVTGTLADIVEKAREIKPPAIIVVGKVVDLHHHLEWFKPLREGNSLGEDGTTQK
jgi:uroporphyrin-III C-methyltransferase